MVLTGPNGAGKTNLLEAISLLAPGRGLRRARLADMDRRSAGEAHGQWAIAARLAGPAPAEIGTSHEAAPEGGRRVVKIDGRFQRGQAALAEVAAVAWLTPAMDRLFAGGAGERRRFLDRLVLGFHPGHAERVAAYDHAMSERGRLLRAPGAFDAAWLGALESRMAAGGIAIAAARRDTIARLNRHSADGEFPRASLSLAGEVDGWLDRMPALAAEEALAQRLAGSRARDRELGGAEAGPHRSDLIAAGDAPAAECSTGEQKALLIAILLAHARALAAARGSAPILLLDEVCAHLDAQRRGALFEALLALGAQSWLTGTDEALFAPLGGAAQFFRVREGAVQESQES